MNRFGSRRIHKRTPAHAGGFRGSHQPSFPAYGTDVTHLSIAIFSSLPSLVIDAVVVRHQSPLWNCREQINLAGLGDTSCGRSLLFCPAEERCLRRAFPGETVRTISRSRPGMHAGAAHRGCQGWPRPGRGHRVAARSVLCAGHVQQPGGASPLCNLMEVKHE